MQQLLAKMRNNQKIILTVIVVVFSGLVFFGLNRTDIGYDDALYSFRALGYLDHTDAPNMQSTPIDWFGFTPGWARLSFHDAPPLVFIVQHLFFNIFGNNSFAAKLPFALAGIASLVVVYLIGRRLYDQNTGLLASGTLAACGYFLWSTQHGYLESLAILFLLLAVLFFIIALEKPRYFIWWGAALGLLFLCKYTAFFIGPVFIVYLLFKNREVFRNSFFWFGVAIAGALFAPVVFYNIKIYQARGHFDLQFATLFGQDTTKDWPGITRGRPKNIVIGAYHVIVETGKLLSESFFITWLLSAVWLLVVSLVKKTWSHALILLIVFFFIFGFAFIGAEPRFLIYASPIIALTIATAAKDVFGRLGKKVWRLSFAGVLAGVLAVELLFGLNTNYAAKPFGQPGVTYAAALHQEPASFEVLEQYLIKKGIVDKAMRIPYIGGIDELQIDFTNELRGRDVVIYDSNLNWFSTLWYFRRWTTYGSSTVFVPLKDVVVAFWGKDLYQVFQDAGVRNVYFVQAAHSRLYPKDLPSEDYTLTQQFGEIFEAGGAQKVGVGDNEGKKLFIIYSLQLN